MSAKKKITKKTGAAAGDLSAFRPTEIAAICGLRFQMGYDAAATARESGLRRPRIREIENAILHSVREGTFDGLTPAQIHVVESYLALRETTPSEEFAKPIVEAAKAKRKQTDDKTAQRDIAARTDLPPRALDQDVPIALIADVSNIRRDCVDDESRAFRDLVESIRANGILEPLIVCRGQAKSDRAFRLVCGHRRLEAAIKAGLETVPAMVFGEALTDEQVIDLQLDENLRRVDLNPADEAEAIKKYMAEKKIGVEETALRIGKSAGFVRSRLKIAGLHKTLLKKLRDGSLPVRNALYLAAVEDQKTLAKHIEDQFEPDEFLGQSLAGLKSAVEGYALNLLAAAPFDIAAKPSCADCEKRSDRIEDLFGEDINEENARCCDKQCWRKKHIAAVGAKAKELIADGLAAEMSPRDFTKIAWHEWERGTWRYLGEWGGDEGPITKMPCRDGCPLLRVFAGSLAECGWHQDIVGLHCFCDNLKACVAAESALIKTKPDTEPENMTPAQRKKREAAKTEKQAEQLGRRVREWAWNWTRAWMVTLTASGNGVPSMRPIDNMFLAITLRAAEKWFSDYVRESFFPAAQMRGFDTVVSDQFDVVRGIVGNLNIGNDLGIDLFDMAKFAGIDLHDYFAPTKEFLTLYQVHQLHALARQTTWAAHLPADWEKLCKRELIEAICALKDETLARCNVPAELEAVFASEPLTTETCPPTRRNTEDTEDGE